MKILVKQIKASLKMINIGVHPKEDRILGTEDKIEELVHSAKENKIFTI